MTSDEMGTLWHWEGFQCELQFAGDVATEELVEVTCPECLKKLENLKERRNLAKVIRDHSQPR